MFHWFEGLLVEVLFVSGDVYFVREDWLPTDRVTSALSPDITQDITQRKPVWDEPVPGAVSAMRTRAITLAVGGVAKE